MRKLYRIKNPVQQSLEKRELPEGSFFKKQATGEEFFSSSIVAETNRPIQRKCTECEKEDKHIQRITDQNEEEKAMQRVIDNKEEESIHKKEAGASNTNTTNTSTYISTLNGKGNYLPKQASQFFSARMGYDFLNVKIHNDKEAADSAKEVNARAYTVGNHIVFNEGQYNTESADGKKLLAHELTHVAQNDDRKLFRQPSEDMENCKGWRSDPHSITVVAANKIMKEELKWDKVTLQKITNCDLWDPDNKRWGCDFITSDKRKGSCLILPKQNRLRIIIARKDGNGGFACFYNFTCDTNSGKITLVKDKCEGTMD